MSVLLVLLVQMFFAGALALSLYVPLMAGQLSLASAAFYGIGGYVGALLSTQVFTSTGDYPIVYILIEMAVAAVLCGLLAIAVGYVTLRLRGVYFMLATIAFVQVMGVIALNVDILNGAVGIDGIPQPFNDQAKYLWFAVPMLILCALFVYRLEHTRIGRAWVALREDELAASSMGINPTRYKVLAFVIGAVMAGIIGAVYAHFLNTWNPGQGTFDFSVSLLAFVLVGGSETFMGPLIGGLVLTALPEVLHAIADVPGVPPSLQNFFQTGRFIIYGLLIMLSVLFFPKGLLTPSLWRRLFRRRTSTAPSAAMPISGSTGKPSL